MCKLTQVLYLFLILISGDKKQVSKVDSNLKSDESARKKREKFKRQDTPLHTVMPIRGNGGLGVEGWEEGEREAERRGHPLSRQPFTWFSSAAPLVPAYYKPHYSILKSHSLPFN